MSKFTDAAATSHTLSVVAMEEASRLGARTADIDHMLLALVVNDQPAGAALRSLGITLDSAREAVTAQHTAQIASLGVTLEPPAPGPITFHETRGYEWGERAVQIIQAANGRGKRGDAAAVLRELVAEPSGLIVALLRRLGTTPQAVLARLDETESRRRHSAASRGDAEPGTLAATSEAFAPAPIARVWEMLADPARMPEWEPSIGSVHDAPKVARLGDVWSAHAPEQRPDGKPIRVKPTLRRQRVELVAGEEGRCIGWLFTYPDYPEANSRRVTIELSEVDGGTQVRLSLAWVRNSERRRYIPGKLTRPLTRIVVRLQAQQRAVALGRAFR